MSAVDLEAFMVTLAERSAAAILPFFRTAIGVDNKAGAGAFDPVTEADRAGEEVMRRLIRQTFPDHGILGEEHGSENLDADHVWVLDPIDGTRAFLAGIPVWGTLIGLMRRGRPVMGLMHQPFTGEMFIGTGGGAKARSRSGLRALRVRATAGLDQATVMTTSPRLFKGREAEAYDRVEALCRNARYGTDCYAYCMVASGHVDLVIESGLKPYDIVALIPIIEGAGGIVTAWDGGPAAGGGRIIAAGDSRVHQAAVAELAAGLDA